jgi:hypothetical protein
MSEEPSMMKPSSDQVYSYLHKTTHHTLKANRFCKTSLLVKDVVT